MARELTGARVAKAFLQNTTATESTLECDFDLTRGEAIAIDRIEVNVHISDVWDTNVLESHDALLTVHAENDALEVQQDALTADRFINDSEVIFETTMMAWGQEEATTRGGTGFSLMWGGPNFINYREALGTPLVLAINPTVSMITSDANLLIVGNFTFWYKYVELSDKEIREAFFRSR